MQLEPSTCCRSHSGHLCLNIGIADNFGGNVALGRCCPERLQWKMEGAGYIVIIAGAAMHYATTLVATLLVAMLLGKPSPQLNALSTCTTRKGKSHTNRCFTIA